MQTETIALTAAFAFVIILFVLYYFYRYAFSVEKQLKNQERIIKLLILTSKKQGASNEEINEAVH